jgi:PAS domain S-box-containing protein
LRRGQPVRGATLWFRSLTAELGEAEYYSAQNGTHGTRAHSIRWDGENNTSAIDIGKHKNVEQALRDSEQRFRAIFDSVPMLIWLADANHLRTHFNRAWLEFTGRTHDQEKGQGWSQSVHPEDREQYSLPASSYCSRECRLRRYDGQYRWILEREFPRFLEDGSLAGFVGCCIDITEQKKEEVARSELSGRLIQAQEQERLRIARELHDDINQRLAILAGGLRQLESSPFIDGSQYSQIKLLCSLADELVSDVQHLSHQLHSSKLQYLGLASAIRAACREFSQRHGIEVECIAPELGKNVGMDTSLCLFRIVQESLHNVAKHSQSRHVRVELVAEPSVLRLQVTDDGVGFDTTDPRHSQGLGLVSMRERARAVGGEFSVRSNPFRGTQIECSVPVKI